MNNDNFVGRHLILDVQTKTMRGINEPQVISTMLEGLSKVLSMTLVYPPIVARFPFANSELEMFLNSLKKEGIQTQTIQKMEQLLERRNDEMAGISGITIWLESHAAVHTWTEENFFSFDAYSCKDFNVDKAVCYILSYFDVHSYNGLDIVRTMNEPQKVRSLSSKKRETDLVDVVQEDAEEEEKVKVSYIGRL
jgi:S-adenosylmethionine decarboxylase